MSIYDTLNNEQREAVFCTEGPLLMLAGAGSGKTRLHPLIYEKRDYIAYGIMLLYVVIMIFCSFILKRFF